MSDIKDNRKRSGNIRALKKPVGSRRGRDAK